MKKTSKNDIMKEPRKGLVDIWNAYMVEGASFTDNDIPLCPTTATTVPESIILWDEAKHIYKNALARGDGSFHYNAFVAFYLDDYKFDGPRGIWHDCNFALKVLRHFAGVITPDFSTYQDFPEPIKIYNTYRMRAFGYWLGKNGLAVINNVRWGTSESWRYCFDGIPDNCIVCIGTVGGSPKKLIDRKRFEEGLEELVRVRKPHTVLVYGSASYPCFDKLIDQGIKVVSYPSRTASVFERRRAR
ncbi:MAG: DUF4417 domain-containing protein [Clostridia bacterium]|nr:DUF4417 domain-containing protein [Clostridia bacterium]